MTKQEIMNNFWDLFSKLKNLKMNDFAEDGTNEKSSEQPVWSLSDRSKQGVANHSCAQDAQSFYDYLSNYY